MATKNIGGMDSISGVDEIVEYQGNYGDFSLLLDHKNTIGEVRVHYLKNLREDWEWVESSSAGKPFVILKRR